MLLARHFYTDRPWVFFDVRKSRHRRFEHKLKQNAISGGVPFIDRTGFINQFAGNTVSDKQCNFPLIPLSLHLISGSRGTIVERVIGAAGVMGRIESPPPPQWIIKGRNLSSVGSGTDLHGDVRSVRIRHQDESDRLKPRARCRLKAALPFPLSLLGR